MGKTLKILNCLANPNGGSLFIGLKLAVGKEKIVGSRQLAVGKEKIVGSRQEKREHLP